ncbi:hypothetical protein JTB14_028043 [Gonioctena quinquepunctata]|nr:hypothetical protein JTB14_028043 [Gonioctena quinquepunctata]
MSYVAGLYIKDLKIAQKSRLEQKEKFRATLERNSENNKVPVRREPHLYPEVIRIEILEPLSDSTEKEKGKNSSIRKENIAKKDRQVREAVTFKNSEEKGRNQEKLSFPPDTPEDIDGMFSFSSDEENPADQLMEKKPVKKHKKKDNKKEKVPKPEQTERTSHTQILHHPPPPTSYSGRQADCR